MAVTSWDESQKKIITWIYMERQKEDALMGKC